jgi:16S rRNA (uracil1498-N3)-methyltransferase
MRRFYAETSAFSGDTVQLDESESHHLHCVLRLRAGDEAKVFDGIGNEFVARVLSSEKKRSVLKTISSVEPAAKESPLKITLAAALMKSEKTDICVQKAVELGVRDFVPIISLRTEKLPHNIEKQMSRWRRIAIDATKQCGRAVLMSISTPKTLSGLFDEISGEGLFFTERSGRGLPDEVNGSVTVIVGPEGGWDDSEIKLAEASANIHLVSLGERILRAETAVIAATAVVQYKYGDLS